MTKAIALTRSHYDAHQARYAEFARSAIVLGCGAALALAGRVLPF